MRSRRARIAWLALLVLPIASARLHAGTIERLADIDSQLVVRAAFPFDRIGAVLGTIGAGADALTIVCLRADRASLWTFGATPESAQPIGGACPLYGGLVPLAGEGDTGAFVYLSEANDVWRTDGTRAGTYLLVPRDRNEWRPVTLVAGGSRAFLFFPDRLATTDGTVAGTREVTRFEGSFLAATTIGDVVVFVASRDNYSVDLWRSDGTAAGTRRLARIADSSFVDPLVKSGDRVFVLLLGSLWVTDGSEAGTRPVVDSFYGFGIYPRALQAIGYRGGIAFEAEAANTPSDQPVRLQVWWSDGTPRGTRRLAKLPSNQLYAPARFRVLGSRLLFTVESELWTSDGTPGGTRPLSGCRGGCPFVSDLSGVELHGALLLRAGDERRGFELWRTDGTGRGTRIVREICPGACGYVATELTPWRGGVAYLGSEHTFGDTVLWLSDGTAKGTVRLAELGELINHEGPLVAAGDHLYAMLETRATGWQLWTLEGTAAGTLPLTRQLSFYRGDAEGLQAWPRPDGGVFVAGRQLLSSDGTRSGTYEIAPTNEAYFLGTIGDAGIAQRGDGDGNVKLLRVPADGGAPVPFVALPPRHWVQAAVPFRGGLALDVWRGPDLTDRDELWVTDGTAAGTTQRLVFPNENARFLAVDRDVLYFATAATGSGGGSILWHSDGTAAGTLALAQRPGLRELVRAGEELFFVASGRSFGPELWRTDGTPAGTRPCFDDGGPPQPRDLFAFDGALYLVAHDDDGEDAVWRLDPATHELAELGRFGSVGVVWTFAAAGDHLFFPAAETALGGSSLYASDGTAAGTVRVAALTPPGDPVYPALPAPVALGDELLFSALDVFHGAEPWKSDGTLAGTRLVRDLVPGPQGSLPSAWAAAGGRAFFAAGDGVRAAGLFLYDPRRPACTSDGERICLDGRWEAEAAFPESDYFAPVPTGAGTSLGPASVLFAHPLSAEPRIVLRASAQAGGASVAAAGISREWWIATVTDTTSGEARQYVGLPGVAVRYDDRAAFPALSAARAMRSAARPIVAGVLASRMLSAATPSDDTTCAPGSTTACLLGGRFSVRGHRGDQPAQVRTAAEQLAVLKWPQDSPPAGEAATDPDATMRIAPLAGGGYEVFFAALAPSQGAAVVRDGAGKTAVYANPDGALTLIDDATTFAPP